MPDLGVVPKKKHITKFEHLRPKVEATLAKEFLDRPDNQKIPAPDRIKMAQMYAQIATDLALYDMEVLEDIMRKEFARTDKKHKK